jgi:uncharacterized repeat protein (TIGR01451 family)
MEQLRFAGAPRRFRIKGILRCLLVAVAATAVAGLLAANAFAGGANVNVGPGPVGICHDTGNSQAHEWVYIMPDASGVYDGHVNHQDGGDIIPAFTYTNGQGVIISFPGQNLTTDFNGESGAVLLADKCVAKPHVPTTPPTTPPPTTTATSTHPGIAIVKGPKSQTVVHGGAATFTITVTNTGDVALTNVTVADLLTPDCNRLIGTMAAGASVTYTCALSNVTASFTNVVVATGTGGGTTVTATDSAPVTAGPFTPAKKKKVKAVITHRKPKTTG